VETSRGSQEAALMTQVLDKHMSQTQHQFSRIEDVLRSIDNSVSLHSYILIFVFIGSD
jgi:ferritin-like metal-binding protein YciE